VTRSSAAAADSGPTDEPALVRRAQAGDRAAFGAIVRAHQAAALRLAAIICGDSTEAYDIVQDSFVKAFHGLPRVRSTESLRPWLMRIVANQAKNARRSRARRDARIERQIRLRVDDEPTPDDIVLTAVAAEHLTTAIDRLSDADRHVIACRYFAGLNEAETASALGVAKGTVKSRTARALVRLRAELGDEVYDEVEQ
jgi:RNA polymerase sigma factor (sigma-70 family)